MSTGLVLRRVGTAVRRPARAWLVVRMLGWAAVLPLLTRRVPLDRLVVLMWAGRVRRTRPGTPAGVADVVGLARWVQAGVHRGDNCLQRSLLVYRQLALIGAEPVLRIGARHGPLGVEGHAWVTVGDVPVHEEPDGLAGYVTFAAYGSGGRRAVPV